MKRNRFALTSSWLLLAALVGCALPLDGELLEGIGQGTKGDLAMSDDDRPDSGRDGHAPGDVGSAHDVDAGKAPAEESVADDTGSAPEEMADPTLETSPAV